MARILVVDDEDGLREFLADSLELEDHEVVQAASGEQGIARFGEGEFDLLVTDLNMPGIDGMELLRWTRQNRPRVQVIVITAHGTVDTAVSAMKLGAFDFMQKPIPGPETIQELVARALAQGERAPQAALARDPAQGSGLSFGAPAMQPVVEAIAKVARTRASVLLLGESGAGKEVAARSVHEQSDRAQGPFVAINCAALTETLLESELFGHEKGAFTGADAQHAGRIEAAEGGSFFLDEVGELKLGLQAKLLRVLQERRYERVGGVESLQADVRWIAATNRDLRAMVDAGQFREDLYHRLAVFPIRLPALRERPEDLLPLAKILLRRASSSTGREGLTLSSEAEAKLLAYSWPGNIRELANTLERASILADTEVISAADLWLEEVSVGAGPDSGAVRHLLEVEKEAIARALEAVDGNRRKAAKLLGIGERTLYDKIKKYELG